MSNCSLRRLFIPTSIAELRKAQSNLLSKFVKSKMISKITALDSDEYINAVELRHPSFTEKGSKNSRTLLLTHGYGSGLGFFWANYDHLLTVYDRVIALDWLGMGGSSRPGKDKYPWASPCDDYAQGGAEEGVEFFIDSLEKFRIKEGLDNFTLAGHSLGGYLSARYALKYGCDNRINGLILISPVGVSSQPLPDSFIKHADLPLGLRAISTAWKFNFTPQSLVRATGPKGKDFITKVLLRRFGERRWSHDKINLIADYLYHISAAKASGEYALNALLQPIATTSGIGVYARSPLADSLGSLKVPALMQFGDIDWLYPDGLSAYMEGWKRCGATVDIDVIPSSGHHLYLDNPAEFHNSISKWNKKHF